MLEATQARLDKLDPVARFISEKCTIAPELSVNSSLLHQAYKSWCKDDGERPLSIKQFGRELENRRFYRSRTSEERLFSGLALIEVTDNRRAES